MIYTFAVIIFLLIYLIVRYISWRLTKTDKIQITFKQFYHIYKSTPSSHWEIDRNFDKDDRCIRYIHEHGPHKLYKESYTIYFKTLYDQIQFYIFLHKYRKTEKRKFKEHMKMVADKHTADLIANWNRDIEQTRRNNIEELQQMIKENAEKAKEYERCLKELKEEILN